MSEENLDVSNKEVGVENRNTLNKKRKNGDKDHYIKNVKNQYDDEKTILKKKQSKQDNFETDEQKQDVTKVCENVVKNKKKTKTQNEIEIGLDSEEYEVEKIVDQRNIKGRRQFLVRWKGYAEESDTWEQEKDLNCDRLIEEFLTEQDEDNELYEKNIKEKMKTKITKNIFKKF